MRNLAGDPNAMASVRDELGAVNVPTVEVEVRGEVDAKLEGRLGPFTFRRAWYYWVVSGPVPLELAERLYELPLGKTDVRSGGDCACRPPATWADHFDADGKQLAKPEPRSESLSPLMAEIYDQIDAQYRFVDDPQAHAARSIVDTYHIDSGAGLRLFVDAIRPLVDNAADASGGKGGA